MAVAVQGYLCHIQVQRIGHMLGQLVEQAEELLGQATWQPLPLRQQGTRLMEHALHIEPNPVLERANGPYAVDATKVAPHPLQLIQIVHLELAPADAMPDGETVALMLE